MWKVWSHSFISSDQLLVKEVWHTLSDYILLALGFVKPQAHLTNLSASYSLKYNFMPLVVAYPTGLPIKKQLGGKTRDNPQYYKKKRCKINDFLVDLFFI